MKDRNERLDVASDKGLCPDMNDCRRTNKTACNAAYYTSHCAGNSYRANNRRPPATPSDTVHAITLQDLGF